MIRAKASSILTIKTGLEMTVRRSKKYLKRIELDLAISASKQAKWLT